MMEEGVAPTAPNAPNAPDAPGGPGGPSGATSVPPGVGVGGAVGADHHRAPSALQRNRRFQRMQRMIAETSYFSEVEIFSRHPDLHEEYMGQFLVGAPTRTPASTPTSGGGRGGFGGGEFGGFGGGDGGGGDVPTAIPQGTTGVAVYDSSVSGGVATYLSSSAGAAPTGHMEDRPLPMSSSLPDSVPFDESEWRDAAEMWGDVHAPAPAGTGLSKPKGDGRGGKRKGGGGGGGGVGGGGGGRDGGGTRDGKRRTAPPAIIPNRQGFLSSMMADGFVGGSSGGGGYGGPGAGLAGAGYGGDESGVGGGAPGFGFIDGSDGTSAPIGVPGRVMPRCDDARAGDGGCGEGQGGHEEHRLPRRIR